MSSTTNIFADQLATQAADVKKISDEKTSGEASKVDSKSENWNNWTDAKKEEPVKNENKASSQLTAVPVVDTTGLDKAMDQALRETMIDQAKAYYPMIKAMSLESVDERVVLEIAYDSASEKDLVSLTSTLNKEQMSAEVQVRSPLLQKTEDMRMEGDMQLVESIQLMANPGLTSTLGSEAQIIFVQKVSFKLLRPVRLTMRQLPGLIRIEFRPYSAKEDENVSSEPEQDLVFQPSAPQTTAQVFGQSFQKEREYEELVNSGGETALIDQLEPQQRAISMGASSNYAGGISADAVMEDVRFRYPRFGSIDYWKKHLSGIFVNTMRFSKLTRNKNSFPSNDPGIAILFDRKGPAHVRLAYNYQREFPFFYGKLHREKRQSPMDGLIRNDIQGGVVFNTQSPWTYSLQNRLSLATSENLGSSSKFGDRLTQYRYEAGGSARYNLKRGFLQLGGGVKFETQEQDMRNQDIRSFLSLLWYRPISKKLAGRTEYSYEHRFLLEGKPLSDMNVHRARFGLDYKPTKKTLIKPDFGLAFYDGESFAGLIGGLTSSYDVSQRDTVSLSYNTDFIRSVVSSFASTSANNTRTTSEATGKLIRFQTIGAAYEHKLSKKMSFLFDAAYRNESPLNTEPKDKFSEYRLSTALRRNAPKKWTVELRYIFSYLDSYSVGADGAGGTTFLDKGNTTHQLFLRLFRYFGDSK